MYVCVYIYIYIYIYIYMCVCVCVRVFSHSVSCWTCCIHGLARVLSNRDVTKFCCCCYQRNTMSPVCVFNTVKSESNLSDTWNFCYSLTKNYNASASKRHVGDAVSRIVTFYSDNRVWGVYYRPVACKYRWCI